jgi:uncharacterized protein (DUF1778 family)
MDSRDRARRRERLEARLTPEQKALFVRAAHLQQTTVTEFVVRSAQRAAEEAIRSHDATQLSVRDSVALVRALLEPEGPNEALRAAARRYRRSSGHSEGDSVGA